MRGNIMIEKERIYKFLEYLKNIQKEEKLYCCDDRYEDIFNELLECVKYDKAEDMYISVGKVLSQVIENYTFNDIFFREDCYEYLMNSGLTKEEACHLTTRIRKGKFSSNDFQIYANKLPEKDFFLWAFRVQYLPSRRAIIRCFESMYDKFDMLN